METLEIRKSVGFEEIMTNNVHSDLIQVLDVFQSCWSMVRLKTLENTLNHWTKDLINSFLLLGPDSDRSR